MTRPARRMVLADLSAGTKGILTEYEKGVLGLARTDVDKEVAEQNYQAAKQKMMRKLFRLENGTNLGDVERIKRDLRRLAKGYVDCVVNGKDSHELWVMCLEITEGKRRL